ncbi:MAG: glycine cleavage T C-terminal barrel domain-containing protein, partial [Thermoplasmata archaeon]
ERFVELDHAFVGRPAIDKEVADGTPDRLVGLKVAEPGAIPRHGTPIRHAGKALGALTSGGMSPSLHLGIALAFLPKELTSPGTVVELELRGKWVPAEVTPLPFLPAPRPPK